MTATGIAANRATLFARRLDRLLRRYGADRRGIAAVEFAMLLPMMLTLYLGSVEVSTGVAINRKVTLTTRALADLTSQYTDVTNADMSNILNASSDIVAPYPVSGLSAVVSELSIDANGNTTVVWSDTLNGTARSVGAAVTIPASLVVPNTYLILAEVSYSYNPSFGYVLTHTMTLNDHIYMRPRQSTSIQRTAS
jgi:Flp pilus assembly protein TadG